MGEKTKEYISVDATFTKLYEAAPKLEWHVSPNADTFVRGATAFAENIPAYWKTSDYPSGSIGCWNGVVVFLDNTLEGKTIELHSDSKVLSAITLE